MSFPHKLTWAVDPSRAALADSLALGNRAGGTTLGPRVLVAKTAQTHGEAFYQFQSGKIEFCAWRRNNTWRRRVVDPEQKGAMRGKHEPRDSRLARQSFHGPFP